MPFVAGGLRPETFEAVLTQAPGEVEFIEHEPGGLHYSDLMRRLWREPGQLVLVLQDVVPPPDSLRELGECGEDWCGHQCPYNDHFLPMTHSLTKFSGRLRRCWPDFADLTLARSRWSRPGFCLQPGERDLWPAAHPEVWPTSVDWSVAGETMTHELLKAGMSWHEHEPPCGHLHDYPAV